MKEHGSSGKKMNCREFIDNLAHSEHKYDPLMLKELYMAVSDQSFGSDFSADMQTEGDADADVHLQAFF